MGYSDDKIESLCKEYLKKGFTSFKIKVGKDLQNDISRCRLIRNTIGWENNLVRFVYFIFYFLLALNENKGLKVEVYYFL